MASSLTTPLTWQLGDNGVILNSDLVSYGTPFVDIAKVSGFDSAPFRETKRDHEGTDGGFMDAEYETGRDIVLQGTVFSNGANLEPYLDSLKQNYAPSKVPVPLYFLTETGLARQVNVKPRGVRYDWDIARRLGMADIQFMMYAEDPSIYDQTVNTITVPYAGSTFPGFSFPFGFPLSFGSSSASGGGYVINSGNRDTGGILTLQGPIANPTITNGTTGDVLQFNTSLGSTDVMVIDLKNHTVKLNGSNARNTMVAPNWFLFPVGVTFLQLTGLSGSGTLTVTYQNAWR